MSHSANTEHPENVIRGHKAALHNPNVSEEAKAHSKKVLKMMTGSETGEASGDSHPHLTPHQSHVLRGHRAVLSNPRTSEEAKEHSRQAISELEGRTALHEDTPEHHRRQVAGFKSALSNPHVSEEAKEHAREMLRGFGEDY